MIMLVSPLEPANVGRISENTLWDTSKAGGLFCIRDPQRTRAHVGIYININMLIHYIVIYNIILYIILWTRFGVPQATSEGQEGLLRYCGFVRQRWNSKCCVLSCVLILCVTVEITICNIFASSLVFHGLSSRRRNESSATIFGL